MKGMKRTMAIAGVTLVSILPLAAQPAGFTRTPLLDQPLGAPGHHGVTARVEIGPGIQSGRHTHPGDEFEYVVEGTLQLEIDGQPPQVFKAGDVFFVPRGVVHNGRNTGTAKTTMIGTYVVETGKALTTPVQ